MSSKIFQTILSDCEWIGVANDNDVVEMSNSLPDECRSRFNYGLMWKMSFRISQCDWEGWDPAIDCPPPGLEELQLASDRSPGADLWLRSIVLHKWFGH